MNKLRCLNHFGAGDLFDAKGFILEWIRLLGFKTADLACQQKFWPIFVDCPQIKCVPLTADDKPGRGAYQIGDTLYLNTWIGRKGCNKEADGYVLWPGPGCVLEKIHEMHDDLGREVFGQSVFTRSLIEYIPKIDYSRVELGASQCFVRDHYGKKLILVCNGVTTSKHASNFQYFGMLEHLPEKEGVIYLFTERVQGQQRPDVFFTDDITMRGSGCDLNAIGYLSQFCDAIIGRCSGAFMFAQTQSNWMDSTKTLVCFVHHRNGACFVRYPEALGLKMKVVWSPATEAKSAAEVVRGVIGD